MDEHSTHLKMAKFSRYLGRISVATRVVGVIIVIGGLLTMLFAIPELLSGRHTEEALALLLVSLGVGGIGVLVWSTGVFHGALSHALVVFGWVDGKLWEIMKRLNQQGGYGQQPTAGASTAKTHAPAAAQAMQPAAAAAIQGPAEPAPLQRATGETTPSESAATSSAPLPSEGTPMAESEPAPVAVAEAKTMRCKHCGGEIPADVLRCKYCLERV